MPQQWLDWGMSPALLATRAVVVSQLCVAVTQGPDRSGGSGSFSGSSSLAQQPLPPAAVWVLLSQGMQQPLHDGAWPGARAGLMDGIERANT